MSALRTRTCCWTHPLTLRMSSGTGMETALKSNLRLCLFLYVTSMACNSSLKTVVVLTSGASTPDAKGLNGNVDSKIRMDLDATDSDKGANVKEILEICFKQPGENAMMWCERQVWSGP